MNNTDVKFQYLNDLIDILKNNMDAINIEIASIWTNTGWDAPPRTRNEFEIDYWLEGSAGIRTGDDILDTQSGDVLFANISEGTVCETGDFKLAFIMFTVLRSKQTNSTEYQQIIECFKQLSQIHLHTQNRFIEAYFMEMIKELSVRKLGYKLKMKLLLLQILVEILRASSPVIQQDNSYKYVKFSEMVSDIISYLSENIHNNITLDELGEKCRLNPRYLNRIFKGVTGFPVMQYQQRAKIEKAKRLLVTSSLNTLDIALELGFKSSQYLSRVFKKVTGLTPGKYKKTFIL